MLDEAKLLGAALPGMQPPEVDRQVTRHGYDGFLALGAGGPGAFGQDGQPLGHGRVSGLEAHQPPR